MDKIIRVGNLYGKEYGPSFAGNVYSGDGLSPAIMTMQGGGREPMIVECYEASDTDKTTE